MQQSVVVMAYSRTAVPLDPCLGESENTVSESGGDGDRTTHNLRMGISLKVQLWRFTVGNRLNSWKVACAAVCLEGKLGAAIR